MQCSESSNCEGYLDSCEESELGMEQEQGGLKTARRGQVLLLKVQLFKGVEVIKIIRQREGARVFALTAVIEGDQVRQAGVNSLWRSSALRGSP